MECRFTENPKFLRKAITLDKYSRYPLNGTGDQSRIFFTSNVKAFLKMPSRFTINPQVIHVKLLRRRRFIITHSMITRFRPAAGPVKRRFSCK